MEKKFKQHLYKLPYIWIFCYFNVHAEVIETLTKIFSLSAFFSYTNLLQVTYLHFFLLSNGQIGNAVIMSEEKKIFFLFLFHELLVIIHNFSVRLPQCLYLKVLSIMEFIFQFFWFIINVIQFMGNFAANNLRLFCRLLSF